MAPTPPPSRVRLAKSDPSPVVRLYLRLQSSTASRSPTAGPSLQASSSTAETLSTTISQDDLRSRKAACDGRPGESSRPRLASGTTARQPVHRRRAPTAGKPARRDRRRTRHRLPARAALLAGLRDTLGLGPAPPPPPPTGTPSRPPSSPAATSPSAISLFRSVNSRQRQSRRSPTRRAHRVNPPPANRRREILLGFARDSFAPALQPSSLSSTNPRSGATPSALSRLRQRKSSGHPPRPLCVPLRSRQSRDHPHARRPPIRRRPPCSFSPRSSEIGESRRRDISAFCRPPAPARASAPSFRRTFRPGGRAGRRQSRPTSRDSSACSPTPCSPSANVSRRPRPLRAHVLRVPVTLYGRWRQAVGPDLTGSNPRQP